MKICILTTSFPAYKGHLQSPFIYELTKTLSKKEEIHVVCPYYKESKSKKEKYNNINIHRFQYFPKKLQTLTSGGGIPSNLKKSWFARIQLPFFLASIFLKSTKIAKKSDIIHAQWALSGLTGVILKKIYKKPLILTTRGAAVNLAIKNKLTKRVLLFIFKNCDYITPNNEAHTKLIRDLGLKKVKTIPNGIDTKKFKPRDKNKIREKLNLPKNKKIILFVGWLIERKGLKYLLEAIKDLNIILLIIGTGILEKQHKEQVKELNIQQKVIFMGPKPPEKIPEYMNVSDIYILPSLSEGRPNTVIEAMASGIPVIATAVDGTKAILKDYGLSIEPKSPKQIKEAIIKILNNKQFAKKLSANGLRYIKENKLSWEKCTEEYIKIYKEVIR
jgi:glycosyltransferase involved in cell wall biosynthesis